MIQQKVESQNGFTEYKKDRAKLLRKRQPTEKVPYYKQLLAQMAEEEKQIDRAKQAAAERRVKQEEIDRLLNPTVREVHSPTHSLTKQTWTKENKDTQHVKSSCALSLESDLIRSPTVDSEVNFQDKRPTTSPLFQHRKQPLS
jgi:hypothetical protein